MILGGLTLNQAIGTAGGAVMARLLPNATVFGQVNLLLQMLGAGSLFLNLGLNSALTYWISRTPVSLRQVSRESVSRGNNDPQPLTAYPLALAGSLAVGGVVALLFLAGAHFLSSAYRVPSLDAGLAAGSMLLVFNSLVNVAVAFFSGKQNFLLQTVFMVTGSFLSTAGIIAGVVSFHSRLGIFRGVGFGMSLAALLTAILSLTVVQRRYHPEFRVFDAMPELRRMLRYGTPMWAGNIAKSFQQPFLVMVTGAVSLTMTAYLSNALKIVGFLNIITWAFNVTSLPFLAEVSRSPHQTHLRGTLCFRYNNFLLFAVTALVLIFPHWINLELFGARYATPAANAYTRILAVGVVFSSISRLGGTLLAGMGRPRANFWVMVVSGGAVAVLAPLVVGQHPLGAGWVYAGGWMASALATFRFLNLDGLWLDWRRSFLDPLWAAMILAVLLATAHWVAPGAGPGFPLILGISGVIAYILVTWWLERHAR